MNPVEKSFHRELACGIGTLVGESDKPAYATYAQYLAEPLFAHCRNYMGKPSDHSHKIYIHLLLDIFNLAELNRTSYPDACIVDEYIYATICQFHHLIESRCNLTLKIQLKSEATYYFHITNCGHLALHFQ